MSALQQVKALAAELRLHCSHCRGTGVTTTTYDEYGMADPKDVPCWYCQKIDALVVLVKEALVMEKR